MGGDLEVKMENGEARLSKGVWWFAVGCVALAAYVVAMGVWSVLGVFGMGLGMGTLRAVVLVAASSWFMALMPVACCAAAWWACLRFAKAAGRPATSRRGRLALLGVVVAVVAGMSLFNAGATLALRAWMLRRMPPAPEFYPYPTEAEARMAAQRNLNVHVGMGMPSMASAAASAQAAWMATAQCFHPEDDEWDAGEWENREWEAEEPLDAEAAE